MVSTWNIFFTALSAYSIKLLPCIVLYAYNSSAVGFWMKYYTLAPMLALTSALGSHFDLVWRVYTCGHDFSADSVQRLLPRYSNTILKKCYSVLLETLIPKQNLTALRSYVRTQLEMLACVLWPSIRFERRHFSLGVQQTSIEVIIHFKIFYFIKCIHPHDS